MIVIKGVIASNFQLSPTEGANENPIRKCRVFVCKSLHKKIKATS